MAVTFKLRRGPEAEWTSDNPILAAGEPGVETDTGRFKIGDGQRAWDDLDYITGDAPVLSVNGETGVVSLSAADVGASAVGHSHGAAGITEPLGYFPVSESGLVALASAAESFRSTVTLNVNDAYYSLMWVPADTAITGVTLFLATNTVVAGANYIPVAVYEADGTKVGQAASMDAWTGQSGWAEFPLATPVAAEAAGRLVYVGVRVAGIASGTLQTLGMDLSSFGPYHEMKNGVARHILAVGASDLVASVNPVGGPGPFPAYAIALGLY